MDSGRRGANKRSGPMISVYLAGSQEIVERARGRSLQSVAVKTLESYSAMWVAEAHAALERGHMDNQFFERPILNSPYEYPAKHWELDESGQPTQQILQKRRPAEFITPIPKPRKQRSVGDQRDLIFDEGKGLSSEEQQYAHTAVINAVRQHVDRKRAAKTSRQIYARSGSKVSMSRSFVVGRCVSTSVSHACGSSPLALAVASKPMIAAARWPARSAPTNIQFLLPSAIGRMAFSIGLLSIG